MKKKELENIENVTDKKDVSLKKNGNIKKKENNKKKNSKKGNTKRGTKRKGTLTKKQREALKRARITYFQKMFCVASFVFLMTCCLWYGGRFIYYYLDSKKTEEIVNNTLANVVISNNELKDANNSSYFYGKEVNNYLKYSNMLFRIIKVDSDNSLYLISDNTISYLNDGDNNYIDMWLNNKNTTDSGIFENILNDVDRYLVKYSFCDDVISDITNLTCDKVNSDNMVGLLSVVDYINTGGDASFVNNGKYTFLSNVDTNNYRWYINNEGKLGISEIDSIYGIKPVIKLNGDIEVRDGNGTIDSPYIIEDKNDYFGSYVKLGNDIWRVYGIEGENLRLMLDSYLMVDGVELAMKYSTTNYYHNDTIYSSLAYYLNNDYLNSLSYKDVILSSEWSNHFYGVENGYNYSDVINNKINTRVSVVSIGDIILNDNNLDDFYTNTGVDSTSNMIYTINSDGTVSRSRVNYSKKIVPTISINKNILKSGNGTKDVPYGME